MTPKPRKLVVIGLSISSSWGNGHATTYRALLNGLAALGWSIRFLERDTTWYADHRDLPDPPFCHLSLYRSIDDLDRYRAEIGAADAVMVGSYVPDGIAAADRVLDWARGLKLFYDIDTPVTLADLESGTCTYLTRDQIPQYDIYLSFTGGPVLRRLQHEYGARRARELFCSVDPHVYRPGKGRRRWALGYLGTYSADRQPTVERLLIEPARLLPQYRFVVAGAQYPQDIRWPPNVDRIEHLPPTEHARFYGSLGWTLNVTRAAMVSAGYSPSVRLFEAAACGTPIISDRWQGLDTIFSPGEEILVADTTQDVLSALQSEASRRASIARAARRRILQGHTAGIRAAELAACLESTEASDGGPLHLQPAHIA